MKTALYYQRGYGGLGMFICAVIIGFIMYFYFYPNSFKKYVFKEESVGHLCRPYVNDDGSIKADAPTIMAPTYDGGVVRRGQPFPALRPDDIQPYRLIKSKVPINAAYFDQEYSASRLQNKTPNEIHCATYEYNGNRHSHFCQWIHEPLKITPNFSKADQYVVFYPAPYSDGNTTDRYIGGTDPFQSEMSNDEVIRYGTYHILFLLHMDANKQPIKFADGFYAADVYQQVKATDPSQPVDVLPESVLKCVDKEVEEAPFTLGPVMESSPDKKQEQLGWFLPEKALVVDTWYKPACKPAINLYPEKEQVVQVKVSIPNGGLTYTDPVYPQQGWHVFAKPDGRLFYLGKTLQDSRGKINYPTGVFPYLYYEGKIADSVIEKPEKGYVIAYDKLASFYDELLPKLGLNAKESREFKEYWLKALPKSPYYFVGLILEDQLNINEPLTISPKEDTMIRVRLYFEALDEAKSIEEPVIVTPKRNGFTVVDWGGMVKTDKDHPFTCVQ
jgi:hypothetical protein